MSLQVVKDKGPVDNVNIRHLHFPKCPQELGARLRGRAATQRSKKGSENVLGRVLGKGFPEGF